MPLLNLDTYISSGIAYIFKKPVKSVFFVVLFFLLVHLLGIAVYYMHGSAYRSQLQPVQTQASEEIAGAPRLANLPHMIVNDDACRTLKEHFFSRTKVSLIPGLNLDQCYYGCQRILDDKALPPRQSDNWRCRYNQTQLYFVRKDDSKNLTDVYKQNLESQSWTYKEDADEYDKGNTSLRLFELTTEECSTYDKNTDQNASKLNKNCPYLQRSDQHYAVVVSLIYSKEVTTK